MRAVALLSAFKIRNSLRTLFTDPRKLVPLLIFLAAVSLPLIVSFLGLSQTQNGSPSFRVNPGLFHSTVFFCLLLLVILTIDTGLGDGLLAFPMSDVDYLFPSPISRRVVLAYKVPVLTLGAVFSSLFFIYIFKISIKLLGPSMPNMGQPNPPFWWTPAAAAMCIGIYLNAALFVAIRFQNRRTLHWILISALGCFVVGLGLLAFRQGFGRVSEILANPILGWTFLPARLASDVIFGEATHATSALPMNWLLTIYGLSFLPMFVTHTNFYEQSIASSERVSSIRTAAKGGYAGMMAARAERYKRRSSEIYTVTPFGQGPVALFWAHLCAAAKRPFINFVGPIAAGVIAGAIGVTMGGIDRMMGPASVVGLAAYLSFTFMASAKTASEAAVRRRELISPLPIKGWQCVLANLGIPFVSAGLFCLTLGASYLLGRGAQGAAVDFGISILFTVRLASRMVVQYLVVLGYPDFSDKVQQFLSMGIYYVVAAPLFVAEVIVCVPAIFLKSIWTGLACLTVFECAALALSVYLTGIASDRAVASGEPVRVLQLFRITGDEIDKKEMI